MIRFMRRLPQSNDGNCPRRKTPHRAPPYGELDPATLAVNDTDGNAVRYQASFVQKITFVLRGTFCSSIFVKCFLDKVKFLLVNKSISASFQDCYGVQTREREREFICSKKHTWHNKTVKILRAGCQKGHSPSYWPPMIYVLYLTHIEGDITESPKT